ncbi:MAG TPA: hypothetical protein PLW86_08830, partial [Rhodocyclaceae bacterium]|nr:hypothetical protein [Rhodocyclaceae bacterium]
MRKVLEKLPVNSQLLGRSRFEPASLGLLFASFRPATLTLTLFAMATWIATHRYAGIWHDGMFYAGQAIFRLDPAPFANDLFFAFGSQDGFTAFSRIYAWAISGLGLPA